ncbi:hypothetical protein [Absidia glauca]|uniref:Uncharacterized protein n=1 Tax=Absidia glauca TaxID=4829 RepID=A0A163JC08_ABSGL|nr:hypothetical protein [Absidia glauca]
MNGTERTQNDTADEVPYLALTTPERVNPAIFTDYMTEVSEHILATIHETAHAMHDYVDQMVGIMGKTVMDAHTANLQRGKDSLANIQVMEQETEAMEYQMYQYMCRIKQAHDEVFTLVKET